MLVEGTKCVVNLLPCLKVKGYFSGYPESGTNFLITDYFEQDGSTNGNPLSGGMFFVPVETVIKYKLIDDYQKLNYMRGILQQSGK